MRISNAVLAVMVIIVLAAGTSLIACGEGDENQFHTLNADDGLNYAKDKTADQRCDVDDLYIADCLDACTCCWYGQWDNYDGDIGDCVASCDDTLIRYQDYPAVEVNIDQFKECVVGCWSVCGKPDKSESCWDECKIYIKSEVPPAE